MRRTNRALNGARVAGRKDDALEQAFEGVLARAPLQHVHHRQRLNRLLIRYSPSACLV